MDAPDSSLADLSEPGWSRGVAVPHKIDVADHRRRQIQQTTPKLVRLLRADLLGVPLLQPGQVDQEIMGAHHAKDMRASKLPGVLHELLEPVPRPLRLLDWGLIRSKTGDIPFQILQQLTFQESRSLTSSSRCFLAFTLSTANETGRYFRYIKN